MSTDVRVGGAYAYTMIDESGTRFPTAGTYREVVEPQRLTFTWSEPGTPHSDDPALTLTLTGDHDSTMMTLTVEGIHGQPGDDGPHDGWVEALANLADYATAEDDK